ncbi:PE-PGRS family protein [Saccharomonospora piscinae]|uniref:PE-PGRS family protein n=1 Tax=Saccharomonospora piscinae TaxID=687388 RepID=A0A1V9AAA8_SACPI|nr:PPE domain-containing protein [Saccharomonospora piscinae]OQO94067.1 PE-PGRS family protein [Saccharomonospora piscinae]TLW95241.1 PPE domain-containing protein [Saccharomonospora piscinae]
MTTRPTGERRYESYSHERLHAEATGGNDPAAAGEIGQEWAGLGAELRAVAQVLTTLSEDSGHGWRGGAADAVRSALGEVSAWSHQAADVSDAVGRAVGIQADAAARARAEMPEPVPYDAGAIIRDAAAAGDVWQLVGLSDAMTARREEAERARQQAIDVMYARDSALDTAVPGTSFPPPPALQAGTGEGGAAGARPSATGRSVPV